MNTIRILSVGRIKEPHWQNAADYYTKRLQRSVKLDIQQVKDAPPKFSIAEKIQAESTRLCQLIQQRDVVFCLDDKGRQHSSEDLAALIKSHYDYGETPCFLVGGAYGFSQATKTNARYLLSLSSLTFPHEMAYIMLLEQLYRVENILLGTGYHHG